MATILMVGDGKSGGDEAAIYKLVATFSGNDYGWSSLSDLQVVSHHLYWFIAKLPFFWLIEKLEYFFPIFGDATVRDFVFSYYEVAILAVAIGASFFYLIGRGFDRKFSFLILILIWTGSYAICFLTGGHVENHLCLWIILRLFLWDRLNVSSTRSFILLGFLDSLIVAIKMYALIFCVVSTFGYIISQRVQIRQFLLYLTIVCVTVGLWIYTKQKIFPINESYFSYMSNFEFMEMLNALFVRFMRQIFSFSYGLLWTFPAIVLPYFYWKKQPDLFIKSTAIFLTMASLAVFPFWHGATGIAGQRYIFPFLLFLLPNIADAFCCLCAKYRRAILIVPVLVVLFFPVVNYRHNAVVALQGDKHTTYKNLWNEYNNLPFFDVAYQPAIFAWKIQFGKWVHKDSVVVLDNDSIKRIEMREIFPMTLYSRISYVTQTHLDSSEKYRSLVGQSWLSFIRWVFNFDLIVWCAILIMCVFKVSRPSYPLRVKIK